MAEYESDLWDELSAIDAKRQKLKETLDRLESKRQFTKSPSFPDSGVDVQSKVCDTSLEELTGKKVTKTQSRKQSPGQTEQSIPGYMLYDPDELDTRDEKNKYELRNPCTSATRPFISTEEHMTRHSTPRVRWDILEEDRVVQDVKRNVSKDVMPPISRSIILVSTVSTSDSDAHGKTVMKRAIFDGTGSWIDYKAHFEACCNINS